MARGYRMQDDSVTLRRRGHPHYSGKSVTKRGEDARKDGPEPGRYEAPAEDDASGGAAARDVGLSTARDSSSIYPQDPIDPRSPNLRTP